MTVSTDFALCIEVLLLNCSFLDGDTVVGDIIGSKASHHV